MIRSLVEGVFKRVLGEYVEELDRRSLNISVYKGEIDLSDVKLRDDVCDKLRLPIRLILGRIQKLYLKVPWNALSSSPVQLEVRGLYLVIAPLDKSRWNELLERQHSLELLQK
jgi:vacuolar protein sorting-associated protein 13A/C